MIRHKLLGGAVERYERDGHEVADEGELWERHLRVCFGRFAKSGVIESESRIGIRRVLTTVRDESVFFWVSLSLCEGQLFGLWRKHMGQNEIK